MGIKKTPEELDKAINELVEECYSKLVKAVEDEEEKKEEEKEEEDQGDKEDLEKLAAAMDDDKEEEKEDQEKEEEKKEEDAQKSEEDVEEKKEEEKEEEKKEEAEKADNTSDLAKSLSALESKIAALTKSNQELSDKLTKALKKPQPRKSLDAINVVEKSGDKPQPNKAQLNKAVSEALMDLCKSGDASSKHVSEWELEKRISDRSVRAKVMAKING